MIIIEKLKFSDWKAVADIYQQGIETGMATFETKVPDWTEWDNNHIQQCRLLAKLNREIVGWAALSPVSSRCVYGGVAEVSVYVSAQSRGKNIGEKLLKELIEQSESEGYWTLQSGIFPENLASIKLHERLGFRKIGYREKIGALKGIWKDNILMEKRSIKIGIKKDHRSE